MKKLATFLCTVFLMFCMIGTANAIPYIDSYYIPYSDRWMTFGETVDFTFDLTNDGFNPNTQDVLSSIFTLNFLDDTNWVRHSRYVYRPWYLGGSYYEYYWVDHDGNEYADLFNDYGGTYSWEVSGGNFVLFANSLIIDGLSDYGFINMTLKCSSGDFWFNSARIDAEGTEPVAPVPEPATMLLLGSGLVGLVGFRRKRKKV